jgi:hypothetical protein
LKNVDALAHGLPGKRLTGLLLDEAQHRRLIDTGARGHFHACDMLSFEAAEGAGLGLLRSRRSHEKQGEQGADCGARGQSEF